MTPLVSIGIPCFNAAHSLRNAIQSALDQTWPHCEIIVVDDGSTDTSLVQASAFGNRVLVIQSPRRGVNQARNMILNEARGEWVQFLDPEDFLEPWKIEKQLAETNGGAEADVIFSPVWIERGDAIRKQSKASADDSICKQWIEGTLPPVVGMLWRHASLQNIAGWRPELACCHEYELYSRSIKEGLQWKFAPTPGAIYRARIPAIERKDPGLAFRTRASLLDALKSWMEKKKSWLPQFQDCASRACFDMARRYARHHLKEAARFHRDRRVRGLIKVDRQNAPAGYRAIYRTFGFAFAERTTALFR